MSLICTLHRPSAKKQKSRQPPDWALAGRLSANYRGPAHRDFFRGVVGARIDGNPGRNVARRMPRNALPGPAEKGSRSRRGRFGVKGGVEGQVPATGAATTGAQPRWAGSMGHVAHVWAAAGGSVCGSSAPGPTGARRRFEHHACAGGQKASRTADIRCRAPCRRRLATGV